MIFITAYYYIFTAYYYDYYYRGCDSTRTGQGRETGGSVQFPLRGAPDRSPLIQICFYGCLGMFLMFFGDFHFFRHHLASLPPAEVEALPALFHSPAKKPSRKLEKDMIKTPNIIKKIEKIM